MREIRYHNQYDAHQREDITALDFHDSPSKTKQSFLKECDINVMMRRYLKTGTLPQGISVGRYADFSAADDYFSAQLTLKKAQVQFEALPSTVRNRFHNDPAQLLRFVNDPANLEEAHDLGLLNEEAARRAVSQKAAKAAKASPKEA